MRGPSLALRLHLTKKAQIRSSAQFEFGAGKHGLSFLMPAIMILSVHRVALRGDFT